MQPFSTLGKIVAVTVFGSQDEIFASVRRHPDGACLELPSGHEMIVDWEAITWVRDLRDEEYDQLDSEYFQKPSQVNG